MNRGLSIKGRRIYLREIRLSDSNENYCRWMNDPEVNKFLESRFKRWTVKKIRDYIRKVKCDPSYKFFAILLKSNDRHIGNIKIGPIDRNHRFGDIGLVIGEKSMWGRGYASEAIKLLPKLAFGKMGFHKLTASAYANNKGSIKAFLRAGFKFEGARKKQYLSGGRYVDAIMVGLVKR